MGPFQFSEVSDQDELSPARWRPFRHLSLLLLATLLLKLWILMQCEVVTNDGPRYINQAIQLAAGSFIGAIESDITFLYSFLIAGLGALIPDLVLAGRLISLTASVLTVIPLYLLISDLWSQRVALLSCSLFVVLPCFNEYAVEVMRDPLFLLVFITMILFSCRVLDGSLGYLPGVLALAVASPFLRLESLVFIPFFVVFFCCKAFLNRRFSYLILPLCFCLLLVVAIIFLDHQKFPERLGALEGILEGVKNVSLWQYSPEVKPMLREAAKGTALNENSLMKIVSGNIRLVYFLGLILLFIKQLTWPGVFLVALGGYRYGLGPGRRQALFHLGLAGALLAMLFDFNMRFGWISERYLYVPVLLVLPWMGAGLGSLWQNSVARWRSLLTIACLFVFLGAPLVKSVKEALVPQPVSAKIVGEWLAESDDLYSARLVSNDLKIPFYAERGYDFDNFAFQSMSALEQRSQKSGETLVSVVGRIRHMDEIPVFNGYTLLKEVKDEKFVSQIYYKPY